MNDSRLPALLFLLMIILGLLQWIQVYPQLPDRMASHFTADGTPNNWQPKQAFFTLMGMVLVLCAVLAFLVPRLVGVLSPNNINLPNKAYWLAPERREETWRFFRGQMAWFGCALLFLLLYATSQAINANLPHIRHFNAQGMWYVLAGFLLFSVVWSIRFIRHFLRIPPK